ncbi:hypothetical protein Q5P01_008923 [Channa striata]|uniref:Uncharacterized protein n=1 Tax=Channa striata TaxID=64152 RepID=A0AA88N3E5_CHASR|nr:hypothetical protein Q5P01_008923 [Channa striata]
MANKKICRRGTKRKAEVELSEEGPSTEKKGDRGEDESGQQETSLWTGIKKGPPRKLKFPQPDDVVTALQEALNHK